MDDIGLYIHSEERGLNMEKIIQCIISVGINAQKCYVSKHEDTTLEYFFDISESQSLLARNVLKY